MEMDPLNIDEYSSEAAERLPQMVFDYYEGGADDEITVRENRLAWQRIALRPRVLIDVSHRNLSTTVLGTPIAFPILTGPCGFNALAHPDGELAVARAVTAAGTVQVVSTAATTAWKKSPPLRPLVRDGFNCIAIAIGASRDRWLNGPLRLDIERCA